MTAAPAVAGQAYKVIDHAYDVVVVGAGGSGLRATMGAAGQGLRATMGAAGQGLKIYSV